MHYEKVCTQWISAPNSPFKKIFLYFWGVWRKNNSLHHTLNPRSRVPNGQLPLPPTHSVVAGASIKGGGIEQKRECRRCSCRSSRFLDFHNPSISTKFSFRESSRIQPYFLVKIRIKYLWRYIEMCSNALDA